jgi:hypothetical protein
MANETSAPAHSRPMTDDDLVARLRRTGMPDLLAWAENGKSIPLMCRAADEIERLRALLPLAIAVPDQSDDPRAAYRHLEVKVAGLGWEISEETRRELEALDRYHRESMQRLLNGGPIG